MSGYREGKSGVNVKRLVQNIAEQYSFEPQIAAIVELVANALDAKSSEIQIKLDKNAGILAIIDNGIGMDKRQFIEYHDFAATTKERGKGIGFAGQGAKLALNFCKKVITETWSSNYHGYSEWCLKGNDAPYKIFDGGKLDLDHLGTKVTLYLNKNSIDFYTEEVIENTIIEHYFPLIHCELREFYKNLFYKDGTKIFLNEKEIVMDKSFEELLEYKKNIIIKFRHNEVYGIIGQTKNGNAFLQDLQGIMICTFGKVIERTYFRKEPKNKERIIGWIEAPYLIEAVTTDKCRFQKGNKTWESFFRKAQTEFSAWLEEIGLLESSIKREVEYTNIEKEINFILKNFPDLSFFGTTIKREVAIPDGNGEQRDMEEGTQKVKGTIGGDSQGGGLSVYPGEEHGEGPTLEKGEGSNATSKPRSIKGGIRITEDERPDVDKESWFDGETVAINKSHPAYKKAKLSGLLNYHILKTVILSIIEFNLDKGNISEPQKAFEIQQRFFKIWGEQ